MSTSVHHVIAFLLARQGSHLSTSALHKMAYFAQGWHLAWTGEPLFDEEIRTRKGGPFIPAMFSLQKDGCVETSWPAGNPAALTADQTRTVEAVFVHYGHLSGINLAEFANRQAPCRLAMQRATEADSRPVIDPGELKAFFKALDDAPKDATAYANRFMGQYTDQAPESAGVQHNLVAVRYASSSLPDDDYSGYHWKCSCGTEASAWIQNWPQSEDEAREEWRLHFE